ncbi:MAG TPA: hypothetical protein PKX92_01415 [Edaphocola sp.]|nr:hypothetical protein [Edaphocola sp.]
MGCLRLDILEQSFAPMQIVYKNNFASYSLKAETESFILKSQILNSILEGLGEGASIHNKGEGNYKFWFNAIGYNSGESGEWQNDGGKAH